MVQAIKRGPMAPLVASRCCRAVDGLLRPGLFKALADPTRLRLLGCMIKCGRACSVSEVAECCSVDFSVVSRHLQALAREDVLSACKSGRSMRYSVRYANLCGLLRGLADAIEDCVPAGTAAERPGGRRG